MADRDIPEEVVEKGAAVDCAATAGAPVSPVQATDRAEDNVPGWDAMLGQATAVLNQAHSYLSTRDLAAAVLSAALTGRTVLDESEKLEAFDANALNVVAGALTDLYGWLPLNVRFGAAAAALRRVNAWQTTAGSGVGDQT